MVECFFSFPSWKGTQGVSAWTSSQREEGKSFGEVRSGYQLLHPRVHEGKVPEHVLVHAVDQRPVCKGQPGLLIQEFLVEIAAVIWRFLDQSLSGGEKEKMISHWTHYLCFHHQGYNLHMKKLASANKVTLTDDHMGVLLTISQTLDHQCYQQHNKYI